MINRGARKEYSKYNNAPILGHKNKNNIVSTEKAVSMYSSISTRNYSLYILSFIFHDKEQ